ncbi:hypothetical protein MLD38_007724 [Melastoma candidum]|uniref:Uncharacterized protein n=1 Tax=Melastoma candidum TaxID=119954 RepID=A0ACB9RS55_9MYRT|nr:hypothetical protein MLD38_007724 [Melastoma candidum]
METAARHFVLVHGASSGAWCWYKVSTLLKLAGHKVTALDMGGCGVSPTRTEELGSIHDYVQPLTDFMDSLAEDDRVVLVGHSFGGFSISLMMGQYPKKIAVAVFVSAFMPPAGAPPVEVLKEVRATYFSSNWSNSIRTKDLSMHAADFSLFCKTVALYYCDRVQVLELARLLGRPSRMFMEDLANESLIGDRYFSVNRVFVICGDDKTFEMKFQRWMVETNPPKEAKTIAGGDHMVMLSEPNELSSCLLEIAGHYR